MESRLGVLGIAVRDRKTAAGAVNRLISEYGDLVIGRLGVPCRETGWSVIALIVEGTTDALGAFSGKLGMIQGVKSRLMLFEKGSPASGKEGCEEKEFVLSS